MKYFTYICTITILKIRTTMPIDKFKYWIDIANEDLDVAEDLFKAKR